MIASMFGDMSQEALRVYPGNTKEEATFSGGDTFRDMGFAWPSYAWVSLQSQTGKSPAYAAYLAQPSTISFAGNKKRHGVSHADDILYLNGTFTAQPDKFPAEAALAEIIQQYWVNFAKTGNPNGEGLPEWKMRSADQDQLLQLDTQIKMIDDPNTELYKIIDLYQQSTIS
jgi:para-nitrobenzyl esterase